MAIHTEIKIPFTVTGGLSTATNGGVNTLSGYTNALSQFTFAVDGATNIGHVAPYISSDLFVWDMGDGTRIKSTSAKHIYNYPGVYKASLIGYTSGGQEYLSTETKELSVSNFLSDSVEVVTDDIVNVLSLPASRRNVPITVRRWNSWQSYNALSSTGYTFNLYASGSKSQALDIKRYNEYKWGHLDQAWSFYTTVTADNGTVSLQPINKIDTKDNEELYYIQQTIKGKQTFTRVTSSYLTTLSGISAVLVGTSGLCDFYYIDDTPKLDESPVFVYCNLDTSGFSDHRQLLNNDYTPVLSDGYNRLKG